MKALWADPEWRAARAARIAEKRWGSGADKEQKRREQSEKMSDTWDDADIRERRTSGLKEVASRPETKAKQKAGLERTKEQRSESVKKLWQDEDYVQKQMDAKDGANQIISDKAKLRWASPEWREEVGDPMLERVNSDPERAGKISDTRKRKFQEDEEFAEEVEAAKDFSEATLLQTIKYQGEAKQDWRASAWILERRFPDRWGAKREVDVNVNNTNNETDDIIISMIEQIAKPYEEVTDDQADTDETDD